MKTVIEITEELRIYMKNSDLKFYCLDKKIVKARVEFNKKHQLEGRNRVGREKFVNAIRSHCKWWKMTRKFPLTRTCALTDRQWETLKEAVQELSARIRNCCYYLLIPEM